MKSFQGLNEAVKVPSWKSLDKAPSPRFIKTHLPLSMLPPNLLNTARVVYVARDPRDVAVSYYYLHKMIAKSLMRSNFSHFWEAFRRDLCKCFFYFCFWTFWLLLLPKLSAYYLCERCRSKLLFLRSFLCMVRYLSYINLKSLLSVPWTPIVSHTNEAWTKRHHPNLHFVFYEDMLKVNIIFIIIYI